MYNPDTQSVRKGNYYTLTLATPVATGSGGGTSDYEQLINKPVINDVEISGNLTLEDLGIPDLTDVPTECLSDDDLDDIIKSIDERIDGKQ